MNTTVPADREIVSKFLCYLAANTKKSKNYVTIWKLKKGDRFETRPGAFYIMKSGVVLSEVVCDKTMSQPFILFHDNQCFCHISSDRHKFTNRLLQDSVIYQIDYEFVADRFYEQTDFFSHVVKNLRAEQPVFDGKHFHIELKADL